VENDAGSKHSGDRATGEGVIPPTMAYPLKLPLAGLGKNAMEAGFEPPLE
jgi:hypothetical protein